MWTFLQSPPCKSQPSRRKFLRFRPREARLTFDNRCVEQNVNKSC